jgi:hypothetical protein
MSLNIHFKLTFFFLVFAISSYGQNWSKDPMWIFASDIGGGYAADASPLKINQRISNSKLHVPINQLYSSCGFRLFDKHHWYGVQFHIQDYYGLNSDTKRSAFGFKTGLLFFQPVSSNTKSGHFFYSIYFSHNNNHLTFDQGNANVLLTQNPQLWADGNAHIVWKRRAIGAELLIDTRSGVVGSAKSAGPYIVGSVGCDWSLPNSKWYANNVPIESLQAERGFMVHIGMQIFLQKNNTR